MTTDATDALTLPVLPYQVNAIEIGENGLTVSFAVVEDLDHPHVLEFKTIVINGSHDELARMMVQLLRQACELIDEALTVKRQPSATKPARRLP